jgi:hypothetical protein
MARVPLLHRRRRSKAQRALDLAKGTAAVWTTVKASSAGARAAKKGAKAYGVAKGVKVAGRSVVKIVAIPAAVVGGTAVWRKARRGGKDDGGGGGGGSSDVARPLGPVASADTVSPPASARPDAAPTEAHAS